VDAPWLDRLVPRLGAESADTAARAAGHDNAPSLEEDETGAPEPQPVDA
jgi:hypothetical protein